MSRLVQGKTKNKPVEPEKKEVESWDIDAPLAMPNRARYFSAIRTNAYMNENLVKDYMEFWAAFRIDEGRDLWRVMHYMIYDLDKEDGRFVSERMSNEDVPFIKAVGQLARMEYITVDRLTDIDATIQEKYPADKYPEIQAYYRDLVYFKTAANIEGIAFDNKNDPYKRAQGKVFADATFKRSEIIKSLQSSETPAIVGEHISRIEDGIISELFGRSADPFAARLDRVLQAGEAMSSMDKFASLIGAFYLGVQVLLKQEVSYDAIKGLSVDDRNRLLREANNILTSDSPVDIKSQLRLLKKAEDILKSAESAGVHTEPFQKMIGECVLYTHLLNAKITLPGLEESLKQVNSADIRLAAEIRESIARAEQEFIRLGGTAATFDKLKYSVHKSDVIPEYIPQFISRYYDTRGKVFQRIQERKAGMAQVKTLAAEVRPGIQDIKNNAPKI